MEKRYIILAILLVLFLIGCSEQKSQSIQQNVPSVPQDTSSQPVQQDIPQAQQNIPSSQPTTPNIGPNEVSIDNYQFLPSTLTIHAGDSVKWTNNDRTAHIIKFASFESDSLSDGQTYNHKFNDKGKYNYICSIHPSMKGTIIVE